MDGPVTRAAASRVQHAVYQALRGRARGDVRVYVSRPRPGRWSVFIAGLPEHPLAITEAIEAELMAGEERRGRVPPRR